MLNARLKFNIALASLVRTVTNNKQHGTVVTTDGKQRAKKEEKQKKIKRLKTTKKTKNKKN